MSTDWVKKQARAKQKETGWTYTFSLRWVRDWQEAVAENRRRDRGPDAPDDDQIAIFGFRRRS